MFSGLVREIGIVKSLNNNILTIQSTLKPKIGASIAVNGACLTVISYKNNYFNLLISDESRAVIALENLNGSVHLEEALSINDKLDGHLVQGHIDCIGSIEKIVKNSNSYDFYITIPKEYIILMIPKGSVCVDGVSLTINEVLGDCIRLTIIPHTFNSTLFHTYNTKRRVNIETDVIARSVLHIIKFMGSKKTLSWNDVDEILTSY